jgi:hypothetical protein
MNSVGARAKSYGRDGAVWGREKKNLEKGE